MTAADDLLLAARAAELARPLDDEADGGTIDLFVLAVGDQHVAMALHDVRGVRPPGPVAQVPGTSEALTGVVGGYGEPLPVADLAVLLGLRPMLPAEQQWVVVLDDPVAPLGLLADAAVDIRSVRPEDLGRPADDKRLVAALLDDGTIVLDTAGVLSDPRTSLAPPDPTEEPSWRDR